LRRLCPLLDQFYANSVPAGLSARHQRRATAHEWIEHRLIGFGEELNKPNDIGFGKSGRMLGLKGIALRRTTKPNALCLHHPITITQFIQFISRIDFTYNFSAAHANGFNAIL